MTDAEIFERLLDTVRVAGLLAVDIVELPARNRAERRRKKKLHTLLARKVQRARITKRIDWEKEAKHVTDNELREDSTP